MSSMLNTLFQVRVVSFYVYQNKAIDLTDRTKHKTQTEFILFKVRIIYKR